jgi:2-polyprenyl-3-methyl-5-hydroxy-6-metoxy-1,4-benzoquinol methylase
MSFKKRFTKNSPYVGLRDTFLLNICAGKNVVHIGCTDWPFAEVSLKNGTLLHANLATRAKKLIGVDIDAKGIELLTDLVPGSYVTGNLVNHECAAEISNFDFELLLVPDVIEHVPNQFDFIAGLISLAETSNAQIIVTTPNVYSLKSFLAALVGLNYTHTDHRLFHDESTLRTAFATDFQVDTSRIAFNYASREITARYGNFLSLVSRVIDSIFWLKPYIADTIIISITPRN